MSLVPQTETEFPALLTLHQIDVEVGLKVLVRWKDLSVSKDSFSQLEQTFKDIQQLPEKDSSAEMPVAIFCRRLGKKAIARKLKYND